MRTEDYYTGEPVITGSPPIFQNENVISPISSVNPIEEAASMASFGAYAYDPASRMMNPGGYGYNPGYGVSPNFMNPPILPNGIVYNPPQYGIGAPPMSPLGNVQPTYNIYKPNGPNPAFQFGVVPQQYQQPQYPTSYHIPGVNISGEYMPPADFEKRISELEMDYYTKVINQEAVNQVNAIQNGNVYGYGYNGGFNYYGMPFYNQYQYSAADLELRRELEKLQAEAKENRKAFNVHISKLAHNFSRDKLTDAQIEERYTGRDVEIPPMGGVISTPKDYWEIGRLYNVQPFDNSQVYRDHFMKVKEEFNKIIPEDSNLQDTFTNMGIVASQYELEEEMHRRRDGGTLYNASDNTYKMLIRKKAAERYVAERGITLPGMMAPQLQNFNPQQAKQNYINNSPLAGAATLADDGTINVSLSLPCNVGSQAGKVYSVNNNEASYDEKRARFNQFIDSIPGSIYLDQMKKDKAEKGL